MPDLRGMDFFQDLAWQPQTVKTSFEPYRAHFGNGFSGFQGSAFVIAEHKLPTPPSAFISFGNGQDGPSPSSPSQKFEGALSDEDFGDFESVPAVTAIASKNENSPDWVPPLPASQLMLQAHGAGLSSALQLRSKPVDSFTFAYPDSNVPKSQHSRVEMIPDAAAKTESTSDVFSTPFSIHPDSFPLEIADMEDTDWGDFVQPSVTMETTATQDLDFFSLDPKETDGGSSGWNSHENMFEKQTISLSSTNPRDILLDQDLSFSTGLPSKSEALCQKIPSPDHQEVKEVSTDGSSCLEIRGQFLDFRTLGSSQDKIHIAGFDDATVQVSSRTFGSPPSSVSNNLRGLGINTSTLAFPETVKNGNNDQANFDLGDPGGKIHPKEKSANGTRETANDSNGNLVPGHKLSALIPLSFFGDTDSLIEEPTLEANKILVLDENRQKEKRQLSSGMRSASSSGIPSDAFSNYIASLYTQSSGSHQRRHSSCTVITNGGDAEQSFESEKPKGCSFEDIEVAHQQETEGCNSKQINVLLKDDVKSLEGVPSWILASMTFQEQLVYLKAWNTLASVCAYELAHGCALWQHAKHSSMSISLISNSQGRSYFIALGQIRVVCLLLEAALQVYRPWVEAASDQGHIIEAALRCCMADWSELKDAVYSAVLEFESGSTLLSSWDSLEKLCSSGAVAEILSSEKGSQMCRLSLLPLHTTFGVPAVKWKEHQYFLPLANLWANCVSTQPPQLPHILS